MSGRIPPVFWAITSVLIALLYPAVVAADDPAFQVAAPLLVAPAPGADLGPVLAASPEGQVWMAWKRVAPDGSRAELLLASSPSWAPTVVAPLNPTQPAETDLTLNAGPEITLTWSQPVTETLALSQQAWLPGAPKTWSLPPNARWVVDRQGFWHAAWTEQGAIRTLTDAGPLTVTLPVSPTTIVTGLVLAVDSSSTAHLAWALRDLAGRSLGVFYAPVISGAQPVRVAPAGDAPRLGVAPTGQVHLLWVDERGLQYASSQDWAVASLVHPGFQAAYQLALAFDTGAGLHLAWTDGETLWRAHSADWSASLQILASGGASDPALAVDDYGRLHVAWARPGPGEQESDLAYLRPLPQTLQVSVVYPLEGDALAADGQARAITNVPPQDVLRAEFYLQVRAGAGSDADPLRSLGIDRDGLDGWAVPLRIRDLEPWLYFRVLALLTGADGETARAWGGWFTVQRPDLPAIWFLPQGTVVSPGDASLSALLASAPGQFRRLDLFLAPATGVAPGASQEQACPPPSSHYLGSYDPSARGQWPAGAWQRFAYDRGRIPDGQYFPVAVAIDTLGRRTCERGAQLIDIEDTMAPHVEITAPAAGALIRDQLTISAEAGDDNGVVKYIDFYLERPNVFLQSSDPGQELSVSSPDLLWLGSDADARDGWGLRVAVRPEMDGDDWRVRAIAFDDQGLSGTARSAGTVAILGRPRPYMATLLPSTGSRLWGLQTVSLFVTEGLEYLARADLYLENGDGAWTYLGALADTTDRLAYEWNTREWPDGDYTLVVVARHTDGHRSWLRRPGLHVANGSPFYLFRSPVAGQTLSGVVPLRVDGNLSALPLQEARFYYRRPGGALFPIAQATAGVVAQEQLTALWHTDMVLDGDYELVAILVDAQGDESRALCPVVVHNATPVIVFQDLLPRPAWTGSRHIAWQAASPMGRPLSVTVEYSPDDGAHWLALAREITATNVFTWATDAYPDSTRARLRLSATDGLLTGQTVSPPLVINNDNEPPEIALLSPLSGQAYGHPVTIAWKASDPDDDELRVDIAYRRGVGEWVSLAQGIPNQGPFTWETEGLPPGNDYAVRVTAVDARSVASAHTVGGLSVVANKPPKVLLMWPHGATRLEKDAVILWQATDPDNDELRIDLYYSDSAGQTWIPLAEDVPNTGYYQWQVSFLPLGAHYRVRVIARDRFFFAEDRSKGNLSIGRPIPPTVRLIYPPAGAEVQGVQPVRWSRSNGGAGDSQITLMVRRSTQGSEVAPSWHALAQNVPDDGFYLWDTRALVDGSYDLKLVIRAGETQAESLLPQPLYVNNDSNHPPQVVLHAPRGGELWSGWREILWQAWDADRDPITATVSISSDEGQHWTSIVKLDARAGRALWDTRTVPAAARYWLRVAVSDSRSITQATSAAPVYIANESGYPPSVFLASPRSPASAEPHIAVPWTAEDVDGDPLSMGLAFSDDGGLSWRELAAHLYDAGQHILGQAAPRAPYLLRLRADDGVYRVESFAGSSSSASSVPALRLLSPRGGERWSGEQEIRWESLAPGVQGSVATIEWSRNGGQTWTVLASGLKQLSSFYWDTRALPNGVYFLRLTLRAGSATSTVVSEPLTLDNAGRNAPVVSLLSPHGGETWWGTHEIRWRAADPDGDPLTISLSYSVDQGATWTAMAFPSSNTGSYIWDTTTMPNADRVWLRVTAGDGQSTVADMSDGPLAIYNPHTPAVALLSPVGGEQWAGRCRISWLATREGARAVKVAVQVSLDMGKTWQTLAESLPAQGSYLWDTSALPNQSRVLVRVQATDGSHTAIDVVPQPVILRNHSQPGVPFFLP